MGDRDAIRVECRECEFSAVVRPGDDRRAVDVYLEHARETGHELDVTSIEE